MLLKLIIAILSIIAFSSLIVQCQDDAPYKAELDSFQILNQYDTKYIDWDTLYMKKQGRNKFVVAGDFKLNLNLGNEQKIVLQVFAYDKEKEAKGIMVMNVEKAVCKFIQEDEDIYPGLKEKSNMPEKDVCPIPKGDYSIKDFEIQADFLPAETPKGYYLLVFLLKNNVQPVAGFEAVIIIS